MCVFFCTRYSVRKEVLAHLQELGMTVLPIVFSGISTNRGADTPLLELMRGIMCQLMSFLRSMYDHGHAYSSKSIDQPSTVANPARGQLNRENNICLSAFAPESLVSRDGFGSPVPGQPAHLHTQTESGAYLRDSSRVPRRRPCIYLKPPYAVGSVPSLSAQSIAYR